MRNITLICDLCGKEVIEKDNADHLFTITVNLTSGFNSYPNEVLSQDSCRGCLTRLSIIEPPIKTKAFQPDLTPAQKLENILRELIRDELPNSPQ
jgi:hypothetical protein